MLRQGATVGHVLQGGFYERTRLFGEETIEKPFARDQLKAEDSGRERVSPHHIVPGGKLSGVWASHMPEVERLHLAQMLRRLEGGGGIHHVQGISQRNHDCTGQGGAERGDSAATGNKRICVGQRRRDR